MLKFVLCYIVPPLERLLSPDFSFCFFYTLVIVIWFYFTAKYGMNACRPVKGRIIL